MKRFLFLFILSLWVADAALAQGVNPGLTCLGASTDNAIIRFDGTSGNKCQNSSATIDDAGVATFTNVNSGTIGKISGNLTLQATGGGRILVQAGSGVNFTDTSIGFSDASTTVDLSLFRDAANTLAQRNGVNAQTFNLYDTWTDASNGSWFRAQWLANRLILGTTANGTGTARHLSIVSGDVISFGAGGTESMWRLGTTGHLIAVTDNTYDIGASGATRPRVGYFADNIVTGATDFIHETSAALADGAGANTATMTNSPVTGNPSKWIAINDNGTTRYIPAW